MKTQHLWADVAHYYSKSEIMVHVDHEKGLDGGPITRVSPKGEDLSVYIDGRRGDGWLLKPILRGIYDVTEGEALQIYKTVYGDDGGEYSAPNALTWFRRIIDSECMTPLFIHGCFLLGIDLFGLIESGQAIRKEATNV